MPDWRALGWCQKGSAGVGLATALLDTGVRMLLCAFEILTSGRVDGEFNLADPNDRPAAGLPNVEIAPAVRNGFATYPFFSQHGALIVSRAERFSKIAGRAGDTAAQWFCDKAIPMGIAKPFKILAQAHTHQYAQYLGDGSVWIFETGCLAETPDYDAGPKLMGAPRPPALGYMTLVQENGETDINETRWVSLQDVPRAMEAAA
jgi:hypothetical protein